MSRRVRGSTGVTVTILITVLALAAALSAGCGSGVDSTDDVLQLGETENGQSFTVSVGDTIEVTLPGNPTTGFEWTAALSDEDGALLEQEGDPTYVPETADETLVGGGGTYTFRFKALAEGQAELKLVYTRSFEDAPPEQTFTAALSIE
jgi:inhibitor of cysteine peptidase